MVLNVHEICFAFSAVVTFSNISNIGIMIVVVVVVVVKFHSLPKNVLF